MLTKFSPRAAATIEFEHDALGRLSERSWVNGTDDYSYDDAGRLLTTSSTNSAWPVGTVISQSYGYDNRGRLIEAEQNNRTLAIDYDSAQRVSQLTYPGGMEVEYVYDLDGRVTQIKRDGNAIVIYTYNALPRKRHCCIGLRRRRPHSAWPERSEGNTPDAAPPAVLPTA